MYSVPGFNMDFPVYRTIYLNISKLIYQAKLPLAEKYNCGTVIGQMKKSNQSVYLKHQNIIDLKTWIKLSPTPAHYQVF